MSAIQSEYVELPGGRWHHDARSGSPSPKKPLQAGLMVFQEAFPG